jgi:betaine reductase
MVSLGLKLAAGEEPGRPADEGYFPRGKVINELAERTGAERAVGMLLKKLRGEEYETEVVQPQFYTVSPAPKVDDLSAVEVALVTDGGLVPAGNPDGIESSDATRFGRYGIEGIDSLQPENYEVRHGGYDTAFVRQDPNRLVPVDIMRELEKDKVIGRLHPYFYATTGVATRIENAKRMGQEIARQLREAGVKAVILTST